MSVIDTIVISNYLIFIGVILLVIFINGGDSDD